MFAGLAMVSVPLILLFKEKDKRSVTLESRSTSFIIMSLLTDKSFLLILLWHWIRSVDRNLAGASLGLGTCHFSMDWEEHG